MKTIDPKAFTDALSQAANGVAIVTTDGEHGKAGLTVSSLCSVCADPALVLACVNADNLFCVAADANKRFAINLLSVSQTTVSTVFAGMSNTPDTDRFQTGTWTTLATGSPILLDSLVSMDCELESANTHGTHRIYIGRVVAVTSTANDPLVYTKRAYASTQIIKS